MKPNSSTYSETQNMNGDVESEDVAEEVEPEVSFQNITTSIRNHHFKMFILFYL